VTAYLESPLLNLRALLSLYILQSDNFAIHSTSQRKIITLFPTKLYFPFHGVRHVTCHTVWHQTTAQCLVTVGQFCKQGSTSRHVTWPIWIVLSVDSGLWCRRQVQMCSCDLTVLRNQWRIPQLSCTGCVKCGLFPHRYHKSKYIFWQKRSCTSGWCSETPMWHQGI
jgi:hypothetical protein